MSLEQQLRFDISRCSLCPLGVNRLYCSPLISTPPEVLLLLEMPGQLACEEGNPWRSPAASFLRRALLHACGADLSRYHLSYLLKCHGGTIWDNSGSKTERKKWAQTCANQYLSWELRALRPRLALVFGEFAAELCFPDLAAQPPGEKAEQELQLEPWHVRAYAFENPLALSKKGGLDSPAGLAYIQRLHTVLGGTMSVPQAQTGKPDLFSLMG